MGQDFPNECPGYDTKQSDGEVPIILELWEMQSIPSLPSPQDPLWLGEVAPDKGPIYGSNRTNCALTLNWIVWNRTVYMHKNRFGIKKTTMFDMP